MLYFIHIGSFSQSVDHVAETFAGEKDCLRCFIIRICRYAFIGIVHSMLLEFGTHLFWRMKCFAHGSSLFTLAGITFSISIKFRY